MVAGFSIVTLLLIMFAGIGAGTVSLAVLDAADIGPFHKINALKTLIGTGANIAASVVFIARGVVDWPAAIMLCIGCFVGGCIAPPITRRIPANAMRWAAVIAGVILTVDLALKTYR
nr:sulfite exporter TauE/SafE family protein [Bifidobacterium callitrichos]